MNARELVQLAQAALPTHWSRDRGVWDIADSVVGVRNIMVNYFFVADARDDGGETRWVLIDAGLPGSGAVIVANAERRFGPGAKPQAILLTHAHFDHVGALPALVEHWPDVPIYAHEMEIPYITGRASYAPPDPWVGGMMSLTSPLYPRGPFDVGDDRVLPLPPAGSVPFLPDWRVIETTGHSPGHVSFFRDADRCLIAGDAFCTTKQESLLAVATQAQFVAGPPRYFTHDWQSAWESVRRLAQLEPSIAATGHGTPMSGQALRDGLHELARDFDEIAMPPSDARYVARPVVYNERGPARIPPRTGVPARAFVTAGAIALGVATVLLIARRAQADRRGGGAEAARRMKRRATRRPRSASIAR
jgi:glyoxylase-like metal-dependent hydrolase (beta-lactamase superfamily II)